jgi:hypothetical protein
MKVKTLLMVVAVLAAAKSAYLLGELHNELVDREQDVRRDAEHVSAVILELGLLERALHERVDGGDQVLCAC